MPLILAEASLPSHGGRCHLNRQGPKEGGSELKRAIRISTICRSRIDVIENQAVTSCAAAWQCAKRLRRCCCRHCAAGQGEAGPTARGATAKLLSCRAGGTSPAVLPSLPLLRDDMLSTSSARLRRLGQHVRNLRVAAAAQPEEGGIEAQLISPPTRSILLANDTRRWSLEFGGFLTVRSSTANPNSLSYSWP